MLDKRCSALLDVINGECTGSGYKVMEIGELMLSMPKLFDATDQSIIEHLSYLSAREYISIKYQDEREVCLMPLTKGRLVTETRIDEQIETVQKRRNYFLYSFFGAFSAGLICMAIILLILLIGGGNVI